MLNIFKKSEWSPYLTGGIIGTLSVMTLMFFYTVIGASTVFMRVIGFILGIFSEDHVLYNDYLSKYVGAKPAIEFQFMMLIGICIGAFVAAKLSGITFSKIPYLWGQNIGFTPIRRKVGAFIGGLLIIIGSRMGGGCNISHGFSGAIQFATFSWLFLLVMFVVGICTAHILYRKK